MQAGKGSVEIGEKIAGGATIAQHSMGPEGGREDADLGGKDLVEGWLRSLHGMISGVDKRIRCWTARAYSRQTSPGVFSPYWGG